MDNEQGHLHPFKLLPAPPGACPECAVTHDPDQPHNRDSLLYQYSFFDKHGRWPTWKDAMVHCPEEIQAAWLEALAEKGVTA